MLFKVTNYFTAFYIYLNFLQSFPFIIPIEAIDEYLLTYLFNEEKMLNFAG